jgi:predicted MPP superfamily phosphohydrolase
MPRIFHPAILVMTALTVAAFSYPAMRLTHSLSGRVILAIPFLSVWLVPVIYWFGRRERQNRADQILHVVSYLSMGWLNFMFVTLALTDLAQLLAAWTDQKWLTSLLQQHQGGFVTLAATVAMIMGIGRAAGGPLLHEIVVKLPNLHPSLQGMKIVQISDLHVGPTVRRSYVDRLVTQTNALNPDLIVLTGDLVDGTVSSLQRHIAPLKNLRAKYNSFLCLGNHDYYSGADAWTRHFESLGIRVLRNQFSIIGDKDCPVLLAGVTDPAAKMFDPSQMPNPEAALHTPYDQKPHDISRVCCRILLAHNPKLAAAGAKAGFDLQLSGHTHGGQFIPWTFVTKLVHAPHFAGLSREGSMVVYVNSGTGTWGPPIRMGTTPELTLITLQSA